MKFSVLTLFPDIIEAFMSSSVIGRARSSGLFELKTVQIRDFAINRYGQVDDRCYGGGAGMLLMAEPVYQAFQSAIKENKEKKTRTIYLSPRGALFSQQKAQQLVSEYEHMIFICGHYEGVDQRVIDEIVDEELSIGDYVLTGGELAVCVVMDAMLRLVPGVLPEEEAFMDESHMKGLLEYPQYTRPAVWRGKAVPGVLLSGHEAKVKAWQKAQSILTTMQRRPDLMQKIKLSSEEWLDVVEQAEKWQEEI
ncbi:MAG: tRNA (guanosine(37)-N1)-methyltransferase TrmD [Clostridia bacterium]|nr:tRNA (guanosine(37)-N1)-methyltransferase TrmD [Clostridia bacterium]